MHIVDEEAVNTRRRKGALLGECSLDLLHLLPNLQDPSSAGVKQSLSFTQLRANKPVRVGVFNVTLLLVPETATGTRYGSFFGRNYASDIEIANANHMVHLMPIEDPQYKWRLRVDLHCVLDAPMNTATESRMPTCYAEFGWSPSAQQGPEARNKLYSLAVPEERHPHWNQQLLFNNPPECPERDGYFWVALFDKHAAERPYEHFYVPLSFFQAFHPVHLQVQCRPAAFDSSPVLFISLVLEEELHSFVDSVCTVAVNMIDFDPLPERCSRCALVMASDNH